MTNFPEHHAPAFGGLLEDFESAIFDNQDLRGVNRVPVFVKRELAENSVEISDIRQRVSNGD